MESKGLLTERIKIMLNKRIPPSKKIGVIGLVAPVLLGAFLLPMARADKTRSEETSTVETVSNVAKNVAHTEGVATSGHVENAEVASSGSLPKKFKEASLSAVEAATQWSLSGQLRKGVLLPPPMRRPRTPKPTSGTSRSIPAKSSQKTGTEKGPWPRKALLNSI